MLSFHCLDDPIVQSKLLQLCEMIVIPSKKVVLHVNSKDEAILISYADDILILRRIVSNI